MTTHELESQRNAIAPDIYKGYMKALQEVECKDAEIERLTAELEETRNINLSQAQDLANYENMLSAFDNGTEVSQSVINLLMGDEEELIKWIHRSAWHCKKVDEQRAENERLKAEIAYCGACKYFQYEGISGMGLCAKNNKEAHCDDYHPRDCFEWRGVQEDK